MRGTIAVRLLALVVGAAVLLTPGVAAADLYWASGGAANALGRAELDGTGVNASFVAAPNVPIGVAVTDTHVYWTNFTDSTIGRANLDGTEVNQSFITGAAKPTGIFVTGTHIYWTNSSVGRIGRASRDGSGVNQAFITGASSPRGVVVHDNRVYWTNAAIDRIGRANTDGTGVDQGFIVTGDGPSHLVVAGSQLYWAGESGAVSRSNLDGTAVDLSFITLNVQLFGLTTDGEHLYWTRPGGGMIGRADLDGTGVDPDFISNLATPYGIAAHVPGRLRPPAQRPTAKVSAKHRRSKLRVDVNPNLPGNGSWRFTVQKRKKPGKWRSVDTLRTKGPNEVRKVDLGKGRYRVKVEPQLGYLGTTSGWVRLKR